MARSLPLLTVTCALVAGTAFAEPPSIQLTGPSIMKLDWSTRGLCAGDLDGDGRTDLAVINNDKAQIDVLLQRTPDEIQVAAPRKIGSPRWEPVLENAPFLRDAVLIGDFMYDLELIDLNGDGRLDLVYTGKRDRIGARIQDEDGNFEIEWSYDKEEPNANVGAMTSADIDGDGRIDLVALTNKAILLFKVTANGETFPSPSTYRVSEDNPQEIRAVDLNMDGRLDLAYVAEGSDRALRVRYQEADLGFGPEFAIPLEVGAAAWDILPDAKEEGESLLVTIKRARSEIQVTPMSSARATRGRSLDIRAYPVPKSGVNASLFAVGDFDGDGRKDIVVADPDGASLYLYMPGERDEFRSPTEFPGPQGITSLAALPRAGKPDAVLLASEKEGMIGISEMSQGRLTFPTQIIVPGEPLLALAADLDGDSVPEIAVATKDGKRFNLEILKEKDGGFEVAETVKLGSIKRSPTGMFASDLDGDGVPDIALFIPREPTRLLRHGEGLTFEEIGEKDSVRTSQFEGVLPERFSVGDFTGDGGREMLVAGKGFVRAYRIGKDGGLQVVDQANGRAALDELIGPLLVDLDGDGKDELIAYHTDSGGYQVLKRDDAGLFRYEYSIDTGTIALTDSAVVDLGGAAGKRLLVFGKDRFWSVPLDKEVRAGGVRNKSYRTDLEDVRYTTLTLGDLDHDGADDIIAVDANKHIIDVLTSEEDGSFKSSMFFKIFEENRFQNAGRNARVQPREILVADLTGDGRDDIVLLCHNVVLLYPQLDPGTSE